MKKCVHCNHDLDKDDVFCSKCGNMSDGTKESEEFIKPSSKVLGENDEFIVNVKHEKKNILKNIFNHNKKKPIHYKKDHVDDEEVNDNSEFITTTSDKAKKSKKFFMHRDDDDDKVDALEQSKKDDFILEGYEGVYYSTSRLSKAKMFKYAYIGLGVIVAVIALFFVFRFVNAIFFPPLGGTCPYECCVSGVYEDKFCAGYSSCSANKCVMEECPSNYECCQGTLYQEKKCGEKNLECSDSFTCVKKKCPYECCSDGDVFAEKSCGDTGSCINNKCYLEPCPYECCEDEALYNDKLCGMNEICSENTCEIRVVEEGKNALGFIKSIIDLVI